LADNPIIKSLDGVYEQEKKQMGDIRHKLLSTIHLEDELK
jgi:hypothetical protein